MTKKLLNKIFIGGTLVASTGIILGTTIPLTINKNNEAFVKIKQDSSLVQVLQSHPNNKKSFFDDISEATKNIFNKILSEKKIVLSSQINFKINKENILKNGDTIRFTLKSQSSNGVSNKKNMPKIVAKVDINFSLVDSPNGRKTYVNKILKIDFHKEKNESNKIPQNISIAGELNIRDGGMTYFFDGKLIQNKNPLSIEFRKWNNEISYLKLPEEIQEMNILNSITKNDIIKSIFGSKKLEDLIPTFIKPNVFLIVKGFKVIEFTISNIIYDLKKGKINFNYKMIISKGKFSQLNRIGKMSIEGFRTKNISTLDISQYVKYMVEKNQYNGALGTYEKLNSISTQPLSKNLMESWNVNPSTKYMKKQISMPALPDDIEIKYSIPNSIQIPNSLNPNSGKVEITVSSKTNPKNINKLIVNINVYNKQKVLLQKQEVEKIRLAVKKIEDSGINMKGMKFELKELQAILKLLSQVKNYKSEGFKKNILGPFEGLYLLNGVDISSIDSIDNWENWSIYMTDHSSYWKGFDINKAIYEPTKKIGSIVFMVEGGRIEYAFLKYDKVNNKWFAALGTDRKTITALS